MAIVYLILVVYVFFLLISFPDIKRRQSDERYIAWWEKNICALSDQKLVETAKKVENALQKGRAKNGSQKLLQAIKQEMSNRGINCDTH